ncbi:hypothetical protein DL89DRAFT_23459 [Linderina pennispora]|uniref:Uncharacterized protein n=1 Tax=Linderina pennispora TaxID=61395 RepID=A0A1Y1WNN3_9FUNG|nr:uncharacterized protein DL89DRAFT_23459 [Linderina pennispora]ORX74836.1 hypothetical protein DL89DRAFT_23459 [Linderina pennispora]
MRVTVRFQLTMRQANGTKPRRHNAQKSSSSNMGVVGGRKYLNRSLLGQGDTYDLEQRYLCFRQHGRRNPSQRQAAKGWGSEIGRSAGRTFSSSTTSTVTSNRNCSRSRATTQKPEKIRRHESWIESLRGRMGRSKTPRDCEADPVRSSGSLPDDTGYWGEDDEVNRVCTAEVHQNTPKLAAGTDRHQLKHRQCKSELINFSRSDVTFVSEADGADTMGFDTTSTATTMSDSSSSSCRTTAVEAMMTHLPTRTTTRTTTIRTTRVALPISHCALHLNDACM